MPDYLNGTELSGEEFQDSLRLRFGLKPKCLPDTCDGCNAPFSVDHAMKCKKGGPVILRHDRLKKEWHRLCADALKPAAVTDEPFIHSSPDRNQLTQSAANGQPGTVAPELRGDVAALGFWSRDRETIFDIRITDADSKSQRNTTNEKVLAKHEKEKKKTYGEACANRRKHFTPLVFTVDGMRGKEANAAMKRLAATLAAKWSRPYSQVCGYVRSRLSLALVRSANSCLRGTRDPSNRVSRPAWEAGGGLSLYQY